MSFLAVIPLDYKNLEYETEENIIKFFRKKLSNDSDALRYFIDLKDFLLTWDLPNPRKAKQLIKANIVNRLITTNIRCDDLSARSVFEEVKPEDEMIAVWLNAKAMPFLINAHVAKDGFISPMPIELLKPFRSVYTLKLFEQLVRFRATGKLYFSIESLKELTGCKSVEYSAIKRDVLIKAEKELLKYGLIDEKFKVITKKNGNKVSKIEITFKLTDKVCSNKPMSNSSAANEPIGETQPSKGCTI